VTVYIRATVRPGYVLVGLIYVVPCHYDGGLNCPQETFTSSSDVVHLPHNVECMWNFLFK